MIDQVTVTVALRDISESKPEACSEAAAARRGNAHRGRARVQVCIATRTPGRPMEDSEFEFNSQA
jgi:hypothetical protein